MHPCQKSLKLFAIGVSAAKLCLIGREAHVRFYLNPLSRQVYPVKPVIEDIHIEDIAHALSLMTRANGHFRRYSVAQHSLNCYREANGRGCSERIQLGCLLHDASESYLSDITRPVKLHLPDYVAIEENLQNMIYDRFGLGDYRMRTAADGRD